MTNPLKKENFDEAELTTSDIAQGARSAESKEAPKPVRPERSGNIASLPERTNPSSISEQEATAFPQRSSAEQAEDQSITSPVPQADTRTRTETTTGSATPLFTSNETQTFHTRWNEVQASFVDEPRQAVEQADSLVATTMKRLAEIFAEERTNLEHQWDRGDNVSTEDLRVALQRYRSFFQRLLSI
jgi:hypothetical protein